MRRCLPLMFIFLYTLAACAPRPAAGGPGPTVWVGQEGIHTLLVVPGDWVGVSDRPTEVSFGERRWMLGHDRSALHACRLVLWPADGAIYLKALPDRALAGMRPIELSPSGAAAMRSALERWWLREAVLDQWSDGAVFVASRPRFHVFRACHDHVAACLRAAGVPLPLRWLPWYTAEALMGDLAVAQRELDACGIRWVEPMLSE
jgi:hypothetical protein